MEILNEFGPLNQINSVALMECKHVLQYFMDAKSH